MAMLFCFGWAQVPLAVPILHSLGASQQLLRKGHLVLHQVVYVLANIKSDKSSAAT